MRWTETISFWCVRAHHTGSILLPGGAERKTLTEHRIPKGTELTVLGNQVLYLVDEQ